MPTGGVNPSEENLRGWFDAGVTCVGMGSQLISKEILANKDFTGLAKIVSDTLALIRNIQNKGKNA
jgi:2-dehydro-3-deoxyphosphogluconate aldolase/(4S)-4-hydroxy-2-oxoglutarate aldolase